MMTNRIENISNSLNRSLAAIAGRADVIVGIILLLGISIMLVPLPTWLMDSFIAVNMGFTVLVLLVAFYLRSPMELSSFPSIILLATLFRLALSISTTRLILLNADAGHIIQSFGEFVIAGSVGVGLIVFTLVTIVQFIVVTKGAERIAEVAARFALDALPGRQIAIDADVRSGDITKEEARERRLELGRESQFYGAMDGAMKFVKGDAIASIIIVIVNLIAGISIGVMNKGMDFGTAVNTYSLLSIGDGLVSQIPSLLIAMAAGSVVTRVNTNEKTNIGFDITKQLGNDPLALALASFTMFSLSFLPGFPRIVFLLISFAFGLGAFILFRNRRKDKENEEEKIAFKLQEEQDNLAEKSKIKGTRHIASTEDMIVIGFGEQAYDEIDWPLFNQKLDSLREKIVSETGVPNFEIGAQLVNNIPPNDWFIQVEGAKVQFGKFDESHIFIDSDKEALNIAGIISRHEMQLLNGKKYCVVEKSFADKIEQGNFNALDNLHYFFEVLEISLQKWGSTFIGLQETSKILTECEAIYPDLVREIRAIVPTKIIADILRRLVDDGVSISSRRMVLEAIIRLYSPKLDNDTNADLVRLALSRQISQKFADKDGAIRALVLKDDAESILRNLKQTQRGANARLTPQQSRNFETAVRQACGGNIENSKLVLVSSSDIRRMTSTIVKSFGMNVPVLAFQEIAPEHNLKVVGTVGVS